MIFPKFNHFILFATGTILLISACAQVPKESTKLSTTVGRDIAAVHQAHRNLSDTLFQRMKEDVNNFVDDVYAPFQIHYTLSKQKERQEAGNQNNLFSYLDKAMRSPDDPEAQKDAVMVMRVIVEEIYADVEDYRRQRLQNIIVQEKRVTAEIERVYDQIERGNATVTAYLASVSKVNVAQDELLQSIGMEGLREKIGVSLSETSDKVADFVIKARKVDDKLDATPKQIAELTERLDKITKGE